MLKQILLDGKPLDFSLEDLPCFIHGADHSGASLFTISLLAHLFTKGHKILMISGYSMARDEFILQTKAENEVLLLENKRQLDERPRKAVFFKRENIDLFLEAIHKLKDIKERVILVKNFDLFDDLIVESVLRYEHVIFSGDIDKCKFKEVILRKTFRSTVLFSKPETNLDHAFPSLERYQGYFYGAHKGEISLGI